MHWNIILECIIWMQFQKCGNIFLKLWIILMWCSFHYCIIVSHQVCFLCNEDNVQIYSSRRQKPVMNLLTFQLICVLGWSGSAWSKEVKRTHCLGCSTQRRNKSCISLRGRPRDLWDNKFHSIVCTAGFAV